VTVPAGSTASFTLKPDNQFYSVTVNSTCGGALSGNASPYTFTTKAITADCAVAVTFFATSAPGASVANCFMPPSKSVKFTMEVVPPLTTSYSVQVTVGPATFNGRTVSGSTIVTSMTGMVPSPSVYSEYWTVTSSGVNLLGATLTDGSDSISNPPTILPLNMKPGDFVDYVNAGNNPARMTLAGFETLTLGGKTFPNTCHFILTDPNTSGNIWYASGYYQIKSSDSAGGNVTQYSGDIVP
jgi:hypothetical protein